jgi:hypothetical protein
MAVFSVNLVPGGRASTINEQFQRTYTRQFIVISDDITDDEYYVRTHLGVSLFSAHPDDAGARLKSIVVQEGEPLTDARGDSSGHHGAKWMATLEYGLINPYETTATGSPEDQPVQVAINGEIYTQLADLDISGNPIVNAAGDPFDPPVERDQTRANIEITLNLTTLKSSGSNPIATLLGYANLINSDVWFGFPVKTLKIQPPQIVPKYSQFSDVIYWRVTYQVAYNPDTWTKKIQNTGYRQLVTVSGVTTQQPILIDGAFATAPCYLDSSGHYLPPPINAGDIDELSFEIYNTLNFTSTFAFPTTIFGV